MKLLKDHIHTDFMFTTRYFKDKVAEVVCAWCPVCGEVNPKLKDSLQERENLNFEMCGRRSLVTWMSDAKERTMWTRMEKEELELKGIPIN